jgi:hypothetical protein
MKTIALIVALTLAIANPGNGQEYRNVVNSAFDTISNGPQSAIIVDINAADRSPERVWQRLVQAVRNHHQEINKGAETYLKSRRDHGLRGSALPFSLPAVAIIRDWRSRRSRRGHLRSR